MTAKVSKKNSFSTLSYQVLWLGSGIRPPRTIPLGPKEGRSRTRFYDKVCCEMRAPDASLAESDDYFADDDTPEVLEDILKSEPKGNR